MTISPPQQLSKVRSKKRYAAWLRLNAKRLKNLVSLQYDTKGDATALSHFASPITGEYKGKKVFSVRSGKGATPTKIRA